jgi:hypothetical protein
MAILSYHIGLKTKPVAYPSYVPQVDRFRSYLLDGKITKLRDRARSKVMQELLRHASTRVTLDTYTQAVTPAKRAAQTAVVAQFFSTAKNGTGKAA